MYQTEKWEKGSSASGSRNSKCKGPVAEKRTGWGEVVTAEIVS